ncbi:hypothetical protein F0L74_08410 [Chitinophaga agrisoli]|uniref:Uncharacterized protein n=1 Tax=Chitinophaga agrisoli TaxID=2607653 RepID=A0A5B2VVG5_9BACT|nr:hypothetical protein [Chitinophaga agrisoli]KAA2242548.1 hypothetical protein F0L74_08410 [Chitinophaga agrisoli]
MKMLKSVLHILLLSCSKATGLIEKELYFRLSPIDKIRLFMHAGICGFCHRYRKHSRLLDRLMIELHHTHQHAQEPAEQDVTALKQRIIDSLEKK